MGTAKEQREARTRKRQKERRDAAKRTRLARGERARTSGERAGAWPVIDAWVSQDWYEPAGPVHAALVRGHGDGTRAVLLVTVDPEQGLTALGVHTGLSEGSANGRVADLAGDRVVASAEPEDVARVLHDGLAWRRAAGRPDPKELDAALGFLSDLDPEASSVELHLGGTEDDEDTVEVPRDGLFGRLARFVGLVR